MNDSPTYPAPLTMSEIIALRVLLKQERERRENNLERIRESVPKYDGTDYTKTWIAECVVIEKKLEKALKTSGTWQNTPDAVKDPAGDAD